MRALRLERPEQGVALLTLDLPERRNAMTEEMTASWRAAVAELATDARLRAVVVTGAGEAFCSGGDLDWIGAEPDASVDDLRVRMRGFYRAWLSVRELEVPVVAAVNGAAIGAGLALALGCDLRYAAAGARLAAPFTRLGMHPGMATTYLLPLAGGSALARDLLLTGRSVTGAEAAAAGLVNAAAPDAAGALAAAMQAARQVAAAGPLATRLTLRTLREPPATLDDAVELESLVQAVTLAGAELREGLAAARERRAPRFR